MTTSINVKCPDHASWRVKVELHGGDKTEENGEVKYAVSEVVYLDPNSERTFTIWAGRQMTVTEEPLEAVKQEKTDGVD